MDEISEIAAEEIRQRKQIERNADSFVKNYFRARGYSTQKAIKEAYLKIVRDRILF